MLAKRTLCDRIWVEEALTSPQLVRVNKSLAFFSLYTGFFFFFGANKFIWMVKI